MKGTILLILALALCTTTIKADDDLHKVILEQDKIFFDAFNRCDQDTMAKMFSKELEFYHDISGVSGYESTLAAGKANCDRNLGLVRTLVPEATKIYPVKDFGAMQIGKHTFCHMENGKNDCGSHVI